MKTKSSIAIPIIVILAIIGILYVIWPRPYVVYDRTNIMGRIATQTVVNDWTLTKGQAGSTIIVALKSGEQAQGQFDLVQTIPPSYNVSKGFSSFFYHHIFIKSGGAKDEEYAKREHPTITYFISGKPYDIEL
ncbi:MAG: hypothetical protein HUJ83_08240 [Veillonella sp.]|nr:hypothetical protein [Veillonella sp.]